MIIQLNNFIVNTKLPPQLRIWMDGFEPVTDRGLTDWKYKIICFKYFYEYALFA